MDILTYIIIAIIILMIIVLFIYSRKRKESNQVKPEMNIDGLTLQ